MTPTDAQIEVLERVAERLRRRLSEAEKFAASRAPFELSAARARGECDGLNLALATVGGTLLALRGEV